MKNRYSCPGAGVDPRSLTGWARRVAERVNEQWNTMIADVDMGFIVTFPSVPAHGLSYLTYHMYGYGFMIVELATENTPERAKKKLMPNAYSVQFARPSAVGRWNGRGLCVEWLFLAPLIEAEIRIDCRHCGATVRLANRSVQPEAVYCDYCLSVLDLPDRLTRQHEAAHAVTVSRR